MSRARLQRDDEHHQVCQIGCQVVVEESVVGDLQKATHDLDAVPVEAKSAGVRSEEHTSELQSRGHLVCRLLLEKKKIKQTEKQPSIRSRHDIVGIRAHHECVC